MKEYLIKDIVSGSDFHAWIVFLSYWFVVVRGAVILIKLIIIYIKEEWRR